MVLTAEDFIKWLSEKEIVPKTLSKNQRVKKNFKGMKLTDDLMEAFDKYLPDDPTIKQEYIIVFDCAQMLGPIEIAALEQFVKKFIQRKISIRRIANRKQKIKAVYLRRKGSRYLSGYYGDWAKHTNFKNYEDRNSSMSVISFHEMVEMLK